MGFKKNIQWGAPFRWGPGSMFWEKIITQEENGVLCPYGATVWYFPPTFTGYVTAFGDKSANKILAMVNASSSNGKDYYGEALCKNDVQFAIDKINQVLKEYNCL